MLYTLREWQVVENQQNKGRKMKLSPKVETANLTLKSNSSRVSCENGFIKLIQRGNKNKWQKTEKKTPSHLNRLEIIDNINMKKKTLSCPVLCNFWQWIKCRRLICSICEASPKNVLPTFSGDLQMPQLLLKPTATDRLIEELHETVNMAWTKMAFGQQACFPRFVCLWLHQLNSSETRMQHKND